MIMVHYPFFSFHSSVWLSGSLVSLSKIYFLNGFASFFWSDNLLNKWTQSSRTFPTQPDDVISASNQPERDTNRIEKPLIWFLWINQRLGNRNGKKIYRENILSRFGNTYKKRFDFSTEFDILYFAAPTVWWQKNRRGKRCARKI